MEIQHSEGGRLGSQGRGNKFQFGLTTDKAPRSPDAVGHALELPG
jgi:hypothetical protein